MIYMKKIISMFLIFAMSVTLFVCPVSAETQSYQNEYLEAEKYIANIDFNYFYNSTNIGDDVKKDLKRIQEFISAKEKPQSVKDWGCLWRRRRDLNPRYPFGVHTISSRARYDHFDTAPCWRLSCRLRYDTTWISKSQALFFFFQKIF